MPTAPGLLPQWQLLVSGMAFFNCAQNLVTLKLTRVVYARKPSEGSHLFHGNYCIILSRWLAYSNSTSVPHICDMDLSFGDRPPLLRIPYPRKIVWLFYTHSLPYADQWSLGYMILPCGLTSQHCSILGQNGLFSVPHVSTRVCLAQ